MRAVGDTAVTNESQPDTNQDGAIDHNALEQKHKIQEDLKTQLWHRSLLRRKANPSWLHLGHTDESVNNKKLYEKFGSKCMGGSAG